MDLQGLSKVMADFNKLEHVFLNVIGNTRDVIGNFSQHTAEDHRNSLYVYSFTEDNTAVVAISGTGGGITKESWDRVFEPFFTTKEVGKNTGLGLSISYNIINDFDGTLEFTVDGR